MQPHGDDLVRDLRDLRLRDYRPASQLRVPVNRRPASAVPAIDAHAHLGRWLTEGRWAVDDPGAFVAMLDEANVTTVVNLDGRWGDELLANLRRYDQAYPERFVTCCHVDWSLLQERGGERELVASMKRSAEQGAKGLKVWKDLGLGVRDHRDRLVAPDDARLFDLWEAAAALALPVFMHTGDPVAFFEPVDSRNERLEELLDHPEWSFHGDRFPAFSSLVSAFLSVVRRHPRTTFVGVHVAGYAEDLAWVSAALLENRNLSIDISARLNELGRQPRAARELVLAHPDRVLFGSDGIPPAKELYAIYFRFLESDDEHFPYASEDPPPTGRWNISGVALPPEVLERVYRQNAEALWRPRPGACAD